MCTYVRGYVFCGTLSIEGTKFIIGMYVYGYTFDRFNMAGLVRRGAAKTHTTYIRTHTYVCALMEEVSRSVWGGVHRPLLLGGRVQGRGQGAASANKLIH